METLTVAVDTQDQNQPIVIAGMHRSGTSLTASVLQKAGIHIGQELLKPDVGNDLGHFEDVDFYSFHIDVLRAQGISSEGWTTHSKLKVPQQFLGRAESLCQNRKAHNRIWAWKDPRTTLFLEFWKEVLPEARFVFVYRRPWEVIDSLFRRGDGAFVSNPNFAIEVWNAYNRAILDFYQQYAKESFLFNLDCLQVSEERFIASVCKKLGVTLNTSCESMYQPDAMHHQVSNTHRPALLCHHFPETIEIYQKLEHLSDLPSCSSIEALSGNLAQESYKDWVLQDWLAGVSERMTLRKVNTELQQAQTELQQAQTELQQAQTELQQAQTELQRTRTELQRTRTELQQAQRSWENCQNIVAAMETSKFWKIRQKWMDLKGYLLASKLR